MAKRDLLPLLSGYEITERDREMEEATGKKSKTFFAYDIVFPGSANLRRGKAARILGAIRRFFIYTSSRVYGEFFLSFGLATLLSHFAMYYFVEEDLDLLVPLSAGAVAVLLAIPLLCSKEAICLAVQNNRLTDALLFDFLCLKRMRSSDEKGFPHAAAYLFGVGFAVLGFFTSPLPVLLGILGAAVAALSLSAPEFAFYLSLVALPYLSLFSVGPTVLAVLLLLAVLSFAKKCALGNRTLVVEQYDFLFLFLALYLFCRYIVAGVPFLTAALPAVFALGYLLTSNLITNRRLADYAEGALTIGAIPFSLFLLWQGAASVLSLPKIPLSGEGVYSVPFLSSDLAAVCLALLAILAVSGAERKTKGERLSRFLLFLLHFSAMILTAAPIPRLVAAVAILLFLAFRAKGAAPYITVGFLAAITVLALVLPAAGEAADFLGIGKTAFSDLVLSWRQAAGDFASAPLFGKGPALPDDVPDGTARNAYLAIGTHAGAFALLFLVLLTVIRLVHLIRYRRFTKKSSMRHTAYFAAAAWGVVLFTGAVCDVSASPLLPYVTAVLFGLLSACLRGAKREYDDRLGYSGDELSPDAYVIDLEI